MSILNLSEDIDLLDAKLDKIPVVGSFLGWMKDHPFIAAIGTAALVGYMGIKMGDNPLEAGINAILAASLMAEGHPIEAAIAGFALDKIGKNHGILDFMAEGATLGAVGLNWLFGDKKPSPSMNPAPAT